MTLKNGVRVMGLRPETVLAMQVASDIYRDHDSELVITSVCEGKHSRASVHYIGSAFDCRISNLAAQPEKIADEIRAQLGADFDVALEADHIHVEFQPKTGTNL